MDPADTPDPTPSNGATPPSPAEPADAPITRAEYDELVALTKGRLGDMGRQMAALKETHRVPPAVEPRAVEPKASEVPVLTRDDLKAERKYGRVYAGLSAEAQKHLDELEAQGASPTDLSVQAEVISKFGGAKPNPLPPSGQAATAAHSTDPAWPTTVREFIELKKEDPQRAKKLMNPNHPFDHTKLR